MPGPEFFPQSIPFYASTENFNYFRGQYPNYTYKEAALNPTNPRDRTVDWEADVVNIFRNDASRTEVTGHRETPDGASLYFCAPIRVDDASCLICHSTPEAAPVEMVKIYGTANGFGWKLNEVIGAQIVSVPAKLADASADKAIKTILLCLGGMLGFVLVAANIIVLLCSGRPVLADMAHSTIEDFAGSLIKLSGHNSVYISCRCRRDTGHFGREYPTPGSDSDLGHSWTKTRGLPELRFSAPRTAPMGSTR